jgi:hypothetical protein
VLLKLPHQIEHGDSYFNTILSGRWADPDDDSPKPLEIPDRYGQIFYYVLYYLQTGEIPRRAEGNAYQTLLSRDDINKLEEDAEFYCLPGLVQLYSKATKIVLKGSNLCVCDIDLTSFNVFRVKVTQEHTRYESEFGLRDGVHVQQYLESPCLFR